MEVRGCAGDRLAGQGTIVVLRQFGEIEEVGVAVVVEVAGGVGAEAVGDVVALGELGEVEEVDRAVVVGVAGEEEEVEVEVGTGRAVGVAVELAAGGVGDAGGGKGDDAEPTAAAPLTVRFARCWVAPIWNDPPDALTARR